MNYIYSQAEVTLIAPAGSAERGLPGVASAPRQAQRQFDFGGIQFAQFVDLNDKLLDSEWATRAWTLQEGVLSKRKLIFTDHGVAFLCETMHCWETIDHDLPPAADHEFGGITTRVEFNHIVPNIRFCSKTQVADQILVEYCKRTLSYAEDALKACLGILTALKVTHYWGVPIYRYGPTSQYALDLYWRHTEITRRQRGFPTWSWTSCEGEKSFKPWGRVADVCRAEVYIDAQGWMDVAELARNGLSNLCDVSPGHIVRVTGHMFRPTWVVVDDVFYIDLPLFADVSIRLNIYLDSADVTSNTLNDVCALVVDRDEWAEKSSYDHWPSLLLLEPHGDSYRRFALAESSGIRVSTGVVGPTEPLSQPLWMMQTEVWTILLEQSSSGRCSLSTDIRADVRASHGSPGPAA